MDPAISADWTPIGDQDQIITMPASPPTSTPIRSEFPHCDVGPAAFSFSHLSDSGTKIRIKKIKSAGNAPAIIRNRQPVFLNKLSTIPWGRPRARKLALHD